jgi:tRNA(His) 5'-end guanylyltransferase
LKAYEASDTQRKAFKGQPIIARLDGKSFHTFCKGLRRPFDVRLSDLMIKTMSFLVDRFQASAGYCQSDEITLAWFADSTSATEYPFDGRFQKMDSLLASTASVYFNQFLEEFLPEKADLMPVFDCRTFTVPNLLEAYHCFLWRQQDCTKNAISMAAQSMFSHKSLQGLKGRQMQEKMWAEKQVNFNDYPAFFRRGTFARRVLARRQMTDMDFERIPPMYQPKDGMIERTAIETCNAWLQRLEDPVSFLFKGAPEAYRTATGDLDDED